MSVSNFNCKARLGQLEDPHTKVGLIRKLHTDGSKRSTFSLDDTKHIVSTSQFGHCNGSHPAMNGHIMLVYITNIHAFVLLVIV